MASNLFGKPLKCNVFCTSQPFSDFSLNQLFSVACLIDFPTNQYVLHPEDAIKITILRLIQKKDH